MTVLSPAANGRAPMLLHVSLIVEALRANPALLVAIAALAQGALWTLVPSLFYAAPPGDVPLTLAIGREWVAGSPYGPPLAPWLAEIAFAIAGIVGVYLLSQVCVIATYWAVFALGRRIVGAAHAAIAILLMAGISAFTAQTIDFGASVLAMPLSALSILFAHRGLTEPGRKPWLLLGVTLGLLLLTTFAGLILFALIAVAVMASANGRQRLVTMGPWAALVIIVLVNAAQIVWLMHSGFSPVAALVALPGLIVPERAIAASLQLVLWLVLTHLGLAMLAFVAGGAVADRSVGAPAFERPPVEAFGKRFIYLLALGPLAIAMLLAALLGRSSPIGGMAPLVILSGLAVVLAAGDAILLYRERTGALVWIGLIVVPPAMVVVATLTLPWTAAVELEVNKPMAAMAEFFTDTFHRRTGRPLMIVIGDARTAGLVALASRERPHLYVDGSRERAPWITEEALRRNGAVILWTATDATGAPPAHLKERFPDMVAEVPQTFVRPVQGRLPLLRIGWAVIRPQ